MADTTNLTTERLLRRLAAVTAVRPELLAAIQAAAELEVDARPDLDFLTVDEAAARVRVRPATVRAWIRTGKLPAQRAGKRVLVRPADLLAMLVPVKPGEALDDEDDSDGNP